MNYPFKYHVNHNGLYKIKVSGKLYFYFYFNFLLNTNVNIKIIYNLYKYKIENNYDI